MTVEYKPKQQVYDISDVIEFSAENSDILTRSEMEAGNCRNCGGNCNQCGGGNCNCSSCGGPHCKQSK